MCSFSIKYVDNKMQVQKEKLTPLRPMLSWAEFVEMYVPRAFRISLPLGYGVDSSGKRVFHEILVFLWAA